MAFVFSPLNLSDAAILKGVRL